ncbi:MAG: hypothetical protein ACKO8O_00545 [Betaproteobacteria bacterium]
MGTRLPAWALVCPPPPELGRDRFHLSADASLIDSRFAAWRLAAALLASTLGSAPMYVLTVVLPEIQRDFAIGRGEPGLLQRRSSWLRSCPVAVNVS